MEVILKFARKNPWAGIAKYKNCKDYIGTYWTRSGNVYTGLTPEDARRLEKEIGYEKAICLHRVHFGKDMQLH